MNVNKHSWLVRHAPMGLNKALKRKTGMLIECDGYDIV